MEIQIGKVESGIPLPPRTGRPTAYGFENLKDVNTSFSIVGAKLSNVRAAIHIFQKKNDGVKLVARVSDGDDANGYTVRVWRTA